tara:strand:- start:340 stop:633 length:294 start_codon:yes stop_codon:yes gene_type:complete
MKLTESRIKEIILEEIKAIFENKEQKKPEDEIKTTTALKTFYAKLAQDVTSISGMSTAEAKEIAEMNKIMINSLGSGEISKYLEFARNQLSAKLGNK